jgi:uroporphyrinogen decarboxylase
LRGGKASYVPIAELGVHPKIKSQFLVKPILTIKDDVEFWYKAGYDYIKLQPVVDFNIGNVFAEDDGKSGDRGFTFKWANEKEGLISSIEDFEKINFPNKEDIDYSNFEEVKQLLYDGMGVIGQYGDIFTMTWEMMGFENFSIALFENPNLITSINNKIGELVLSMFEYFAQSDAVDCLWYSDDIAYSTGLLVSPDILDQYFFPWLSKIGSLAAQYDKPLIYHSDGMLYDVMHKIIDCGVNSLHPIEPKAMDLNDVKNKYGDKLSLIGGIDVDLLCRGNEKEIETKVIENIEAAAYNGSYCIGSGNSIPEYVNFNNYIAMIKAAKKYGRNI